MPLGGRWPDATIFYEIKIQAPELLDIVMLAIHLWNEQLQELCVFKPITEFVGPRPESEIQAYVSFIQDDTQFPHAMVGYQKMKGGETF